MRHKALHFTRHYVEMVIAMFAGMLVLGLPLALALAAVGIDVDSWSSDAPELLLFAMAFTMTVPMAGWMRYRGHGWAPTLEMSAAMFVPTVAALALLWGGTLEDGHGAMMVQHIAMGPAMLVVMLLRREEYTRHA